jgi:hypothetical protein
MVVYWSYRAIFCCSRRFKQLCSIEEPVDFKYNSVHPSKTPWMWIGAEMKNGKIITVTDEVNKHIVYGDLVDETYLKCVTLLKKDVVRWLYLDPITLNEQEFPPEGLLIQDDSIEC